MQNLTLQQLFGSGVAQDSQFLYIRKIDLSKLTPSTNNTAESLLVAILLQAWSEFKGFLVDETNEAIVDEIGETINYAQRELYEKLNIWFWKRQFGQDKIVSTFIIDVFITPPSTFSTPLTASQL